MGQIPAKYMYSSAPYGASDATNSIAAAQPSVQNPQTPLLPTGFTNPGPSAGAASAISPQAPNPPQNPQAQLAMRMRGFFGS